MRNLIQKNFSCEFDTRALDANCDCASLATTIVHEAAHARLWKRGIGYEETQRVAIERYCMEQEIAFAKRLPDGQHIIDEATDIIASLDASYYSDSSFQERAYLRFVFDIKDMLKSGTPVWLVRCLLILRKFVNLVRRAKAKIMSTAPQPRCPHLPLAK